MKIGVLDSGLGGLSILKTLINKCPNHEYIYFGDTKHIPYGDKGREEVINYGNNIIKFLENMGAKVIVIACGTLSSNKEYLKSNVPLIDVISPLNNKIDNYPLVSVIATPLSVKTNAYKNYIHTNLELISCPLLVPLIENNEDEKLEEAVKNYLNKCKGKALVLGCTHYGLIKDKIKKYYPYDIISLDTYLKEEIAKLPESHFDLQLYFSLLNDKLINNVKNILEINDLKIERRDIEC